VPVVVPRSVSPVARPFIFESWVGVPRPSALEGRGFCYRRPHLSLKSRTPPLKSIKDGAPTPKFNTKPSNPINSAMTYGSGMMLSSVVKRKKERPGNPTLSGFKGSGFSFYVYHHYLFEMKIQVLCPIEPARNRTTESSKHKAAASASRTTHPAAIIFPSGNCGSPKSLDGKIQISRPPLKRSKPS